jgi:DHA1 family multidrug resistance protein-like MFS transporter
MTFVQVLSAAGFYIVVPFLPLYLKSLQITSGIPLELQVGLVYSGPSFAMMVTSPFWGALADRYGRKLMVERALFGGALVFLLMGYVKSAEQLVFLRIIQGGLTGTLAATNALVASVAPRDRLGYSMGVLQLGLGAGLAIGPIIGGAVADLFEYSYSFILTAGLMTFTGLLVILLVKDSRTPKAGRSHRAKSYLGQWRSIFSSPGIPTIFVMRSLIQVCWVMILPILPLFVASLTSYGEGINSSTGFVVGASSASMTISSAILGQVSDRVGKKTVILICAFSGCLLNIPQYFVVATWQLIIFQVLSGISLGGLMPITAALISSLTKSGEEGVLYGIDNAINAGSRALAPMLASAIALAWGVRVVFLVTGGIYFLITLIATFFRPISMSQTTHEAHSNDGTSLQ